MNTASLAQQAKQGSNKWKKLTNHQKLLQKALPKSHCQMRNQLTKEWIPTRKIDKVLSISSLNFQDQFSTTKSSLDHFTINCQVRDIIAIKAIRKEWSRSVLTPRCRRREPRKLPGPRAKRDSGRWMKTIKFTRLLTWYQRLITMIHQREFHCSIQDQVQELISKTKDTTLISICKHRVNTKHH